MKNKLFLVLLLTKTLCSVSLPFIKPVKEPHLRYMKIGTEIGVGYRFHQQIHGIDFSLNYSSFFGESSIGGKALYLLYPFSHPKAQIYFGAGAGILHGTLHRKGPTIWGDWAVEVNKERTYPTIETSLGYQFPIDKKIKVFAQIDLTIPWKSKPIALLITGPGQGWKPALNLGLGF